MTMMQNILKGLSVSSIILLLIALFLSSAGVSSLTELGALSFLIPVFPVIGIVLGYGAGRFQTRRYLKLFIMGLGLIFIAGLGLAIFMVFADPSSAQNSEKAYSVFILSVTGFLIYGTVMVPVLLLGVYILEKWTRR